MTYVMDRGDGIYDIPIGDPELLRYDGQVRANLSTILADSWSSEDRAEFGVYDVVKTAIPDGFRAIRTTWEPLDSWRVHEVHIIEAKVDVPVGRIGGQGVRRRGRIEVSRRENPDGEVTPSGS